MAAKDIIPHQFKKGEVANPNGRPRKYVSMLKEHGYKLSEVNDAIQALLSMDIEELSRVLENPKATILELTIAKAMMQSLKKGSLYSMETLLTRVYGKPKETQQVQSDSRIEVVFVKDKTIL